MTTCLSPNKHGHYNFVEIERGHKLKIVERKRNTQIWDFLDSIGKRSIIINIPLTYPHEEINGVIIPGMDTPKEKSDIV